LVISDLQDLKVVWELLGQLDLKVLRELLDLRELWDLLGIKEFRDLRDLRDLRGLRELLGLRELPAPAPPPPLLFRREMVQGVLPLLLMGITPASQFFVQM
jgi:hypothetical protein